ncbi:hypothetical protein HPO_05327 [Hyphomonas polymorpha PS728]|uniref:Uncharacterized protein n=1 Tax=Hyphomonas polymorpha PS728 TaxID=1280954 RepID=A0A062VL09_9PROT|nr:hypothetical protein [Hyphomonas polymorpha]KCZ99331.1 hypothetical protein HPO_05327 [Hyphomonas polymorpha PS728]
MRGFRDRGLIQPELFIGRGRTTDFSEEEVATALILYATSLADLGANSLRLVAGAVRAFAPSRGSFSGRGIAAALNGIGEGQLWVIRFSLRQTTEGQKYTAAIMAKDEAQPKSATIVDAYAGQAISTSDVELNPILLPLVSDRSGAN